MAFTIDTTTYNKPARYPVGHGYSTRPSAPTSVVVHSTNNDEANTKFENEAKYLYESPNVSADYLIGKDGRIVRFLDSRTYQAWHAGNAQAEYTNAKSIGIELHKSLPDPFYPQAQLDALAWLLRQLTAQYGIAPTRIDTHGQIAIAGPYIRKTDPDDWLHADFVQWRDAQFAAPGAGVYSVRHSTAVFESPAPDGRVALNDTAVLVAGQRIEVDEVAHGGWAHLTSGLGFIPVGILTRIG